MIAARHPVRTAARSGAVQTRDPRSVPAPRTVILLPRPDRGINRRTVQMPCTGLTDGPVISRSWGPDHDSEFLGRCEKKSRFLIPALSGRAIMPPLAAHEGRLASVCPRSRMQGSTWSPESRPGGGRCPSRVPCPEASERQVDGMKAWWCAEQADPLRGAARKGRRRNFVV
jgi:hypothetical protein